MNQILVSMKKARRMFVRPFRMVGAHFSTQLYDVFLTGKRQFSAGDIPLGKNALIYLIYPNFGLQHSHLLTLEYFRDKGFSPIVVSTKRLSPVEVDNLRPYAHQIIQRPNFGYDFGGYRDGVRFLKTHLGNLDRLAILNDSCWFPTDESIDWIAQVEALDVDFAGSCSHAGVPTNQSDKKSKNHDEIDFSALGFHYSSFAICLGSNILKDPRFYRFWKHYKLSDDKMNTIARGEVGFTHWAIKEGFSHASTLNLKEYRERLQSASVDEIRQIVSHRVHMHTDEAIMMYSELMQSFDGSEAWAEKARAHAIELLNEFGPSYSFPDFHMRELRFPFLKKSPVWWSKMSSDQTVKVAANLTGRNGEIIRREVQELRDNTLVEDDES